MQSLKYGYPLVPYIQLAFSLANATGHFTTNAFYHSTTLANSSFDAVVRPNVDTLYSEALVDLSEHDMIISVPEIDVRFIVVAYYDLYVAVK
jgi:hypothetical protein